MNRNSRTTIVRSTSEANGREGRGHFLRDQGALFRSHREFDGACEHRKTAQRQPNSANTPQAIELEEQLYLGTGHRLRGRAEGRCGLQTAADRRT